jgi:hypothetical protein
MMSNVAEFIEIRKSIETLASQITACVAQKAVQESKRHLDEANRQLEVLKPMVDNDVQVIVAGRLTRQLTGLGTKVEKMVAKLPVRKRPAGKLPTAKSAAGKNLEKPARPDNTEGPEITVFERP